DISDNKKKAGDTTNIDVFPAEPDIVSKDDIINIETLPTEEPEMVIKSETINIETLPAGSEAAGKEEIIDIESLPVDESTTSMSDDVKLDIQKAQIALAKAYIDMGEYAEAKTILIQLSKEAEGEQAKQVALLLESLS
ncbi:MAG TPA: hypothetical protein PLD88_01255, partial [Candidatus Berkiella sp.]|nr:hypothetical protein [Candidatus Berkiella sp.]